MNHIPFQDGILKAIPFKRLPWHLFRGRLRNPGIPEQRPPPEIGNLGHERYIARAYPGGDAERIQVYIGWRQILNMVRDQEATLFQNEDAAFWVQFQHPVRETGPVG